MSVFRGPEALSALRVYLSAGHDDGPTTALRLPAAPRVAPVSPWLWDATGHVPGHLDPAAYALGADANLLGASPAQALGDLVDAESPAALTEPQRAFIRRSLDVTMKGGITSGVVYPLAVCELAREFRFRNIGGASAGAIAAAMTAAAEYARMTGAPAGELPSPNAAGRLRAGFAGVADIVAWLTQLDGPGGRPDEFRLAQLFKPAPEGRSLFRVLAAVMRGRLLDLPALILLGVGPAARRWLIAVLIVAPLLLAFTLGSPFGLPPGPGGWALSALLAIPLLVLGACVIIGPLAYALALRRPEPPTPDAFAEPVASHPDASPRPPVVDLVLAAGSAVILVALVAAAYRLALLPAVLAHVLAEIIVALGVFALWLRGLLGTAKANRYGLIGGANPAATPDGPATSIEAWADRRALPPETVTPGLTDWLTSALDDLAGLEGRVLRFGHLWGGTDYTPGVAPDAACPAASGDGPAVTWHDLSAQPLRRLVNLELISTELVRRQPYRFPLPDRDTPVLRGPADGSPAPPSTDWVKRGQLCFDPADLARLFPAAVVSAMTAGAAPVAFRTPDRDATGPVELYPLPQPWDLPVVFAVRASLSFPTLFQAIRLYEVVLPTDLPGQPTTDPAQALAVRTEYGQPFAAPEGPRGLLRYPALPPGTHVAHELWLTDGGVTSNFPIHLFDTVLPLWPTVGLDLGDYPLGAAHQDVKLSLDDPPGPSLLRPLRPALTSFLAAMFGTALSWRDSSQLVMPAYRGRIAVVRQGADEGGTNLYMTTDKIASLALRGMVAGMRLRRRFADEDYWRRHQWLRLRVAAENLGELAVGLRAAQDDAGYRGLLDPAAGRPAVEAIDAAMAARPDPSAPLSAYLPGPGWRFWDQLRPLLPARPPATDAFDEELPRPVAELRQVPPG